jgi:hypothetical protein
LQIEHFKKKILFWVSCSGPSAVSDPLDWMTRLNIAHDAAKGAQKKNWFEFLPLDGESKQFLYFAISS